jgi:hypothetical protein
MAPKNRRNRSTTLRTCRANFLPNIVVNDVIFIPCTERLKLATMGPQIDESWYNIFKHHMHKIMQERGQEIEGREPR